MTTAVSVAADDPIGRGEAMRQLREAIASADAGRPTAVVITGVGGIGKSTLLDAIARQVVDGTEGTGPPHAALGMTGELTVT